MSNLNLDRKTLGQFLPNPEAVRAFEQMFRAVGDTLPTTIEEANALAGNAVALAAQALTALAALASAVDQLAAAPGAFPPAEADDTSPRAHLGTMITQNHDSVAITGGTINLDAGSLGAPSFTLGGDTGTGLYRSAQDVLDLAIAGVKLVEWSALLVSITGALTISKQLTVNVATGTPPFVIASSTNVPNLNASSINGATFAAPGAIGSATPGSGKFTTFGCNGQAPQTAAVLPPVATDLASVITLANGIRSALVANGIGQ